MMKIRLTPSRMGYVTARPLSQEWERKFSLHMKEMGQRESAEAFFQGDYELPESVLENRRVMRDLQGGWDAVMLVDPWEFGHWLGWDAHTVCE